MTAVAPALLDRLDAVEARLAEHAQRPPEAVEGRLTDPDQPSGERWEWGQVWAHLAEFIPYWVAQARHVVASYHGDPVPFGRVKSDAARIAAIERDRDAVPGELMARLRGQADELRGFLRELPDSAWGAQGVHQTLGVMRLDHLVEEFLVGHLEQHAAQLDGLAGS